MTRKLAANTQEKDTSIVKDFDKQGKVFTNQFFMILAVIAVVGLVSGYIFAKHGPNAGPSVNTTTTSASSSDKIAKGMVVGANDTSTFKDTAEGKLATGGIDGDGDYHLVRPGGDSQNVYLTSSTLDLSKFVGHQVEVWGQTQAAQHAAWLMDVGKLEVTQ